MTRKELLIELTSCPEVKSQKAAATFLDYLESTLTTAIAAGSSVTISKTFGTFKPITRSGISTLGDKKPYTTKSVKFSISTPFKRTLNS